MSDRWKLAHNERRLVVAVDKDASLSGVETGALAGVVSSELYLDDVDEVVMIGPNSAASGFMEFYDVAITIGTLVNDAGKAFKIAH